MTEAPVSLSDLLDVAVVMIGAGIALAPLVAGIARRRRWRTDAELESPLGRVPRRAPVDAHHETPFGRLDRPRS